MMRYQEFDVLGIILVLIFRSINCGFLNEGVMQFGVELDIFSGRSSPRWVVSRDNPMYARLAAMASRSPSTRMNGKLGYRGFTVEMRNPLGQKVLKTVGAGTNPQLELTLLNSSPFPLESAVKQNVIDVIKRRDDTMPYITLRPRTPSLLPIRARVCRLPRFDPENWNYSPTISRNNCYNYATQRQTNTFAQPGRASGRRFSQPLTADGVLSATIRDGLVPLPFFIPRLFVGKCYIALAIWPGTDYHFYRLDSNMLWSHKPGKTEARNTDNSGNLIVDPRLADRGNYVIFAGYLGNHPGVIVV